jgi:hypothetical protein
MEITMSATHENNELAIRALADEEFDAVSGGCYPIPVSDGHGGFVLVSPTINHLPQPPIGTGPTFPTFPD